MVDHANVRLSWKIHRLGSQFDDDMEATVHSSVERRDNGIVSVHKRSETILCSRPNARQHGVENDDGILFKCKTDPGVFNIGNEYVRERVGVANIGERIREARLRWLGHAERKTEEGVVMKLWMWVDTER